MRHVSVEQTIQAPKERIWRACSSAAGLRAWQADEVEGELRRGAELILGWPTLGVAVELEVERVEPGRLVILSADDSRLELEVSEGRVALTHSADFDDDERDGTLSSWRLSLATLAHYLENHDGRTRQVHWAVSRAKASFEDAHAFFTLSAAQSGWLTRPGSGTGVGDVGSEVALDLAWGSALSGSVLSHTPPRDVLLSWRETNDSLLALRTLPSPDTANERLLIATWSSWDLPETAPIAHNLASAVTRLSRMLDKRASA
ncbi:MAG TPA: SRPBCC domain-containing protein [Polyangiaceae bacterium]